MKMRVPLVLAAVMLLTLVLPALADRPTISHGRAIYHDTSPPLRDIAIRAARPTGLSKEVPIQMRRDFGRHPDLAEPDGGLQSHSRFAPPLGATPAPGLSVPGLSEQDNINTVGVAIVPPDTNGDIGLDGSGNRIYIQYINLIWGVYDHTGALTSGPFAGNSFWVGFGGFCEANNDGDPVVLYDDQAGRWLFSQFSVNQGIQCVAVSTTSDPLGAYHRYAFPVTPGGINDYPKLGVWDDGTTGSSGQSAYTFTLRDFGGAGGPFSVSAGVMERDEMLLGNAAQFVKFSNPCTVTDCVEGQLPPHLAGPTRQAGTCPTYWTAVDAAYDYSPFANDGYRNHTLCVDWSNLGNSTYTEGPLVVAGSNFDRFLGNGFSDCIGPVKDGEVLDCLAIFTMYRAQYRWVGSHASVVLNTTVDAGSDRAGIRWAENRSADGQSGWFLQQDGTYAPDDGLERWMGSIAQDQDGNIALGYSVTSDSLFPSVRYTSRMGGDAAGTMPGGEVSCHEGTGAQTASGNRWGDYSSMSVDPTDDCTFWYTQEYYEDTGAFDFNTRICSFKFDTCVANDDCENAIGPLPAGSVTAGSTSNATADEPPDIDCGTSVTAPGVWYTVTGTGNTMTASTCNDGDPATGGADYDTKISVYCDDCETLECVGGQDDDLANCAGFSTKFAWPTQAGQTYNVLVHGFSSQTGDFDLAILDDGVPATGANDCDGIPEEFDFCADTEIPESVPTTGILKRNHSALTDDSGIFETAPPNPQGVVYTIEDTAGCSCEQIVDELGLGRGHLMFGCSYSAMDDWLAFLEEQSCGNCVEAHGGIGCDVLECEDAICAIDPFCCNVAWDGLCVLEALDICVPDICITLPSSSALSTVEAMSSAFAAEPVSKDPNYTPKEGQVKGIRP